MLQPKAIVCLLLSISLAVVGVRSAENGNYEDADRGSDFVTSSFGDADGQWDLRHSIPGEPEVDYPIYSIAPKTSFSCENRHEGYYADVETRCQVFRICTNTDLSGEGFAFLCPNGTLFSQRDFVCDWYRNVDCADSENYYFKNEDIGTLSNKDEVMKTVKEMVEFPMKTITKTIQSKSTIPPNKGSAGQQKSTFGAAGSDKSMESNRDAYNKGASGTRNSNSNKSFNINIAGDEEDDIAPATKPSRTSNQRQQERQQHQQQRQQQQTQQQNQRQRNEGGQNRGNDSRQQYNKHQSNVESRERQKNSGSSRSRFEFDKTDKFNSQKVYVNSLGELSTDPGVNFDAKSSLIIEPDQTNERGRNREQKKSLDDVLGNVASGRNHLDAERREKLRQGLPGTDSKRVHVSSKVKGTYVKGDDGPDDDEKNSERFGAASKARLSFAERINAGLNGFLAPDSLEISGNSNNSNIPEFVRNFIDKNSGRKSQHDESRAKEESRSKFLNLADNVNGGFLSDDQGSSHHTHVHREYYLDKTVNYQDSQSNERKQAQRVPKVYTGEDILSEPISGQRKSPRPLVATTTRPIPTTTARPVITNSVAYNTNNALSSNVKVGQAFVGTKTTEAAKTKTAIDEYRSGRQFQFFGSGFTKPGQTPVTLAPITSRFEIANQNSRYLPPVNVQPFVSHVSSSSKASTQTTVVEEQKTNSRQSKHQSFGSGQFLRSGSSNQVQNLETVEEQSVALNEIPRPSKYYLPPAEFTSRTHQPASNVPDLLLMVGDINAAEETKPIDNNDVTVKRRAEALLLQGVHQAFFENERNENAVDESVSSTETPAKLFDPLVIHVNEDAEAKDADVTNIEKVLAGNIRNFLKTGIENEIKSVEQPESTTVEADVVDVAAVATDATTIPSIIPETTASALNSSTSEAVETVSTDATLVAPSTSTEADFINTTTDEAPTSSTVASDIGTTTASVATESTETTTQSDSAARPTIKRNGISMRRLTIKPINYSKKPFTPRTYPKTSPTSKTNKLTNNPLRRRPLNRLGLKESTGNETASTPTPVNETNSSSNATDADVSDLQAIANSYRPYRPTTTLNRLRNQNDTAKYSARTSRYRSSSFLRNRNGPATTTTEASTTQANAANFTSLISSNLTSHSNLSNLTNLIPFDILSKALHANTESTNLQSYKTRQFPALQQTQQTNFLNQQQPQPQRINFNTNINETARGTQKTFETQSHAQPKALYTQIPGTNIKISKSNEEASYSFDPQTGLKPQPIAATHQSGYVPLEQYITQTLSKTLSAAEYAGLVAKPTPIASSQTTQHHHQQHNPITIQPTVATQQQSQHNQNIFTYTSLPNIPTFRPSNTNSNTKISNNVVYQQQQQSPQISIIPSTATFISQPSQINSLQPTTNYLTNIQQGAVTSNQPRQQQQFSISSGNRPIIGLPSVPPQPIAGNQQSIIRQQELAGFINNIEQQQQQQHSQYPSAPAPTTSSFSFNQFGSLPPQPILLNSIPQSNKPAPSSSFEQFVQQQQQLNNVKGYPPNPLAIFNEIPIAQRRFDLEDNDAAKIGKSLYSGVSSYHVPLGSVGRLAGDIAAAKRFRRHQAS